MNDEAPFDADILGPGGRLNLLDRTLFLIDHRKC